MIQSKMFSAEIYPELPRIHLFWHNILFYYVVITLRLGDIFKLEEVGCSSVLAIKKYLLANELGR